MSRAPHQPARLTREECQALAEEKLRSLGDLSAGEALERFPYGKRQVWELDHDAVTGKPFRCLVVAYAASDGVHLSVSVSPEPRVVRPARRLKALAEFVDGYRNTSGGIATRLLASTGPFRPE